MLAVIGLQFMIREIQIRFVISRRYRQVFIITQWPVVALLVMAHTMLKSKPVTWSGIVILRPQRLRLT